MHGKIGALTKGFLLISALCRACQNSVMIDTVTFVLCVFQKLLKYSIVPSK